MDKGLAGATESLDATRRRLKLDLLDLRDRMPDLARVRLPQDPRSRGVVGGGGIVTLLIGLWILRHLGFKSGLLAGGAIGYVLGARAGRERYDKIAGAVGKARSHPMVRAATDRARSFAERD